MDSNIFVRRFVGVLVLAIVVSACSGGPTGPGKVEPPPPPPAPAELFMEVTGSSPPPGSTLRATIQRPDGMNDGDTLDVEVKYGVTEAVMEEGKARGDKLMVKIYLSIDGVTMLQGAGEKSGNLRGYDLTGTVPNRMKVDKDRGISQTNHIILTLEWLNGDLRSKPDGIFYKKTVDAVYKWQ
jgi:hypothetical protein